MPAPPADPTLEAELDRALDPYGELLPPDLLAAMRETLADALTTHPVGIRVLERVRPPPVVARSGDAEVAGGELPRAEDANGMRPEGRGSGGGRGAGGT